MAITRAQFNEVVKGGCPFLTPDSKKGTTADLQKLGTFTVKDIYKVDKDNYYMFIINEDDKVYSTGSCLTRLFDAYPDDVIGTTLKYLETVKLQGGKTYEKFDLVD